MQGESPQHDAPPRQRPRQRPARRTTPQPHMADCLFVGVMIGAFGRLVLALVLCGFGSRPDTVRVGEQEAAAGRVYSCGTQDITGFPFRIQAHCVEAGAQINSNQPPFAVNAKDITFAAQVYHPTRLVANVTGPLTLSIRDSHRATPPIGHARR